MIDKYAPVMEALSFAHYPYVKGRATLPLTQVIETDRNFYFVCLTSQNDCFNGGKTPEAIQDMFPSYLTHDSVIEYVTPYIASADKATELGLGVHMLEVSSSQTGRDRRRDDIVTDVLLFISSYSTTPLVALVSRVSQPRSELRT